MTGGAQIANRSYGSSVLGNPRAQRNLDRECRLKVSDRSGSLEMQGVAARPIHVLPKWHYLRQLWFQRWILLLQPIEITQVSDLPIDCFHPFTPLTEVQSLLGSPRKYQAARRLRRAYPLGRLRLSACVLSATARLSKLRDRLPHALPRRGVRRTAGFNPANGAVPFPRSTTLARRRRRTHRINFSLLFFTTF